MKIFYSLLLGLLASSAVAQNPVIDTGYRKPLFDFDHTKPPFVLTAEQKENSTRKLRFSMLTGYREGVEKISGLLNFTRFDDKESHTARIMMFNLSIQDMLGHGFYNRNRVVLEVNDPSKFAYHPKYGNEKDWMRKNAYCFEWLSPITTTRMLDSLIAKKFNVRSWREKRRLDVLVLVRTSNVDKVKSMGGSGTWNINGKLDNYPLGDGVSWILYANQFPHMIDETGYRENVNMDLWITPGTDLQTLRKKLQQYDLDLKEEKREVTVMIIRENNFKGK